MDVTSKNVWVSTQMFTSLQFQRLFSVSQYLTQGSWLNCTALNCLNILSGRTNAFHMCWLRELHRLGLITELASCWVLREIVSIMREIECILATTDIGNCGSDSATEGQILRCNWKSDILLGQLHRLGSLLCFSMPISKTTAAAGLVDSNR